jgi:hypothetical protein
MRYCIHFHPLLEHPETNMSRQGIELGPPASQASTLAKSYWNNLWRCNWEPVEYHVKQEPLENGEVPSRLFRKVRTCSLYFVVKVFFLYI